jgi:hypothetical protein
VRPSLLAVPAKRIPPGLGGLGLDITVTGRDSDVGYTALASGGFANDGG